jgi:hypothetical protein
MRIKSKVLIGLVFLICLVSGVSFVKRIADEKDLWRPSDVYSSLGVNRRSTFSSVTSVSGASSDFDAVSSGARSMPGRGIAFSYAPASASTHGQMPIAGTSSYSQSPIANSQGLYTTSSAEIRSFGGGGNGGGVSMSGGAVQSSGSSVASSAGLSVSMPSTSVLAVNNTRNNSSVNDVMSSVSGDIAMASSQAYAGIGNTTKGIAGRKNVPGIGGEWAGWLDTEWSGGSNDITFDMLKDLYARMTGDTDFSNQELWDAFLAWFEGNQSNDKFGWYWAPISDAVPFVLLLCLVYAFVIYRKTKMAKNVKAEK